ncbi:MAG: hypothetical protein JSV46_10395 [Candidatus Aminicenantes bacterium]|nr:MAG: hypothetical protein JSV46_10395 [Candidatus Aminicenantes bacterium]
MRKKKKFIALFVLVIAFHSFFLVKHDFAQQVGQKEKAEMTQEEESQEKIIAGPQNITESTGIYVFIAWMWLAIFVLIYILVLKIKEEDRLLEIRFISEKKK